MSAKTTKVDVKSFFQDLICYLSNQDDLAGFEIQQTQQVMEAVAELIEIAAEFHTGVQAHVDDCEHCVARNERMRKVLVRVGGAA